MDSDGDRRGKDEVWAWPGAPLIYRHSLFGVSGGILVTLRRERASRSPSTPRALRWDPGCDANAREAACGRPQAEGQALRGQGPTSGSGASGDGHRYHGAYPRADPRWSHFSLLPLLTLSGAINWYEVVITLALWGSGLLWEE